MYTLRAACVGCWRVAVLIGKNKLQQRSSFGLLFIYCRAHAAIQSSFLDIQYCVFVAFITQCSVCQLKQTFLQHNIALGYWQDLFLEVYKRFMTDSGPLIARIPVDPAMSPEDLAKVHSKLLFAHQQKYKEVPICSYT